jgi:hypothetical protein
MSKINLVRKLNHIETIRLTLDARVMAIRWDLIPWSLVLDLDVKDSEAIDASTYRAWLVFTGISELSWPLDNTRLPHGCFLTSEMTVTDVPNDFKKYGFMGLLPSHLENGATINPCAKSIDIKAKGIIGVCSVKKLKSEDGFIGYKERVNLVSDEEMLVELERAMGQSL